MHYVKVTTQTDGTTLARARAAKTRFAKHLADEEMVQGIGICRIGTGYGVKLNLNLDGTDAADAKSFSGVPVLIEVVGRISARPARKTRERK